MTILIGLLAGAHTSSWGMYKDAPHEGFTLPKYFRSIVVSTLIAIFIDRVIGFRPDTFAHAAVFFGRDKDVVEVARRSATARAAHRVRVSDGHCTGHRAGVTGRDNSPWQHTTADVS